MKTTSAPRFVLHPSVHEPGEGIWFATPPGFTALPLDALLASPGSPEGERLGEALAPLLASAPDEVTRQRFTSQLAMAQGMFRSLGSEGVAHCSLGLHRDDIGAEKGNSGVLLSLFTVTWVNTAWAPRGVAAARAVATAEGHTHVAYAELSCGPATFSETVRTATPESGLSRAPLLQLHAHLPHPDGTSLATLTLSTTAVVHREHYRTILRRIADLAGFEDPMAPAAVEGSLGEPVASTS